MTDLEADLILANAEIAQLKTEIAELKQQAIPIALGTRFRLPEMFGREVKRMVDCEVTGVDVHRSGTYIQYDDGGAMPRVIDWARLKKLTGGSE